MDNSKEKLLFDEIGHQLDQTEKGQLFGKICFKMNKKAFICFFQNSLVCKLTGDEHQAALNLEKSKLFDPSGKNRPMKEWVQIDYIHNEEWAVFAQHALNYLNNK